MTFMSTIHMVAAYNSVFVLLNVTSKASLINHHYNHSFKHASNCDILGNIRLIADLLELELKIALNVHIQSKLLQYALSWALLLT